MGYIFKNFNVIACGLMLSILNGACGRQPVTPQPTPQTSVPSLSAINGQNDPQTKPTLHDGSTLTSFTGSVVDLRVYTNLKDALPVNLPNVLVSAVSGKGDTIYVADAVGGDYSGIQVQSCDSTAQDYKNCLKKRLPLYSSVSVTGKLTVIKSHWFISPAVVTLLSSGSEVLHPTKVSPNAVARNNSSNGHLLGTYIKVQNAKAPTTFVVTNVTPGYDKNQNFKDDLTACSPDSLINDTTGLYCCTNGPAYFSFEAADSAGNLISIANNNYKDVFFSSWPCSASDLTAHKNPVVPVKLGTVFTQMGGIFDINFGNASISPTNVSDYMIK